jgi:parallel beta-helix repeat protein
MLAIFLLCMSMATAGSLTPTDPPASTMKPLNEVEPRIAISSLPYTINQSGSYYLTRSVHSADSGIWISVDNVTLDLMGFTLEGSGNDYSGILIASGSQTIENVVVRNGIVRNFQWGVRCNAAENCRFEGVIAADNTEMGFYFWNSSAVSSGNVIDGCTAIRNGIHGINSTNLNAAGEWSRNSIVNSRALHNGSAGIQVTVNAGTAIDNVIEGCFVADNGAAGISISSVQTGTASGTRITDCRVAHNGGIGVVISMSASATAEGNQITGCMVLRNTDRGILIARTRNTLVEGNQVSGTIGASQFGIRSEGTLGNIIIGNVSTNNGTNYFVNGADTYGPIVSTAGELPTTGAAAHPWANFSR